MGADMITAAVALEKGKHPDFEAGRQFLSNLNLKKLDIDGDLADLLDEEEHFDEDGNPLYEEILSWLYRRLEDFAEAIDGRGAASIDVRDLTLIVVGGMSWGDAPDGCSEIWAMYAVPGLLNAMGFDETYYVEKLAEVTPDEEAAALQSIAKANPNVGARPPHREFCQEA